MPVSMPSTSVLPRCYAPWPGRPDRASWLVGKMRWRRLVALVFVLTLYNGDSR